MGDQSLRLRLLENISSVGNNLKVKQDEAKTKKSTSPNVSNIDRFAKEHYLNLDWALIKNFFKPNVAKKAQTIKNTDIYKYAWILEKIPLNKLDLQIEGDSKTIKEIQITKISGGKLFKRDRNSEAKTTLSESHHLDPKDFLELYYKFELVFEPNGQPNPAILEFTVTKQDGTKEKRTVKIEVREATDVTEEKKEKTKTQPMFHPEFASTYSTNAQTKAQVQKIQRFLRIKESGNYDQATVAKVKEFQQRNGLTPDGIWGPKTTAKAVSQNSNLFLGF